MRNAFAFLIAFVFSAPDKPSLRFPARGKDPLALRVHAERGAEEEAAGGQLRPSEREAGRASSPR